MVYDMPPDHWAVKKTDWLFCNTRRSAVHCEMIKRDGLCPTVIVQNCMLLIMHHGKLPKYLAIAKDHLENTKNPEMCVICVSSK